ncbi:MAG: hypothetical protein LBK59_09400 [Bifidobacteriaceae bacterium]|jgi:hypothetical protein|nr:hypothetical protein [Bifidobacteriaceae bacterium]
MPTILPRTQVTHTEPIRRALDLAGERWPGLTPQRLLVRLIEEGADSLGRDRAQGAAEHRRRVEALAGRYPGLYSPDYLDELRKDWPE